MMMMMMIIIIIKCYVLCYCQVSSQLSASQTWFCTLSAGASLVGAGSVGDQDTFTRARH